MFGHRTPAPIRQRAYLAREVRAVVWDRCGGRCVYCGRAMNPFRDFTVDHVVPVHRGGSDDLSNLVGSCRHCNFAKGARSADAFLGRTPLPRRRHRSRWGWLIGR